MRLLASRAILYVAGFLVAIQEFILICDFLFPTGPIDEIVGGTVAAALGGIIVLQRRVLGLNK